MNNRFVMKHKKYYIILTIVCVLFSLFFIFAFFAGEFSSEHFTYPSFNSPIETFCTVYVSMGLLLFPVLSVISGFFYCRTRVIVNDDNFIYRGMLSKERQYFYKDIASAQTFYAKNSGGVRIIFANPGSKKIVVPQSLTNYKQFLLHLAARGIRYY